MMRKIIFLLFLITVHTVNAESTLPPALTLDKSIQLAPNAPTQYTFVEGDDLLNVLALFVVEPSQIVQLWGKYATNIQAGDTLSLLTAGDAPILQIKRGRAVKLSPMARSSREKREPPIIPTETIQQFLNRPKIITEEELESAGYIIASSDQRLLSSTGSEIYARGLNELSDEREFIIVRLGQTYTDDDSEVLAREAIYLGDAMLEQRSEGAFTTEEESDVATLTVVSSTREIQMGDYLLPLGERKFNEDFHPHLPYELEDAKIIAVFDGVSRIGQYQIVVINKGEDEDIEVGHVMEIRSHGERQVEDPKTGELVYLPSRKAGTLMVFRTFNRVSYAIIMKAHLAIRVFDRVVIPQ